MVTQTCNPSSQETETEDREFKASLNDTERPSQRRRVSPCQKIK